MNQWALGFVLVMTALAGGVLTLLRASTLGGRATGMTTSACVLVLAGAIVALLSPSASAVTVVLLVLAFGLAVGALHVARPAARVPAHAAGQARPAGQPTVPRQIQPDQGGPTGGWTPNGAQPDWNVMSGVWSIPRGTFDGPPP